MKTRMLAVIVVLLASLWVQAQSAPAVPAKPASPPTTKFVFRTEMGKWWQNPDVAKKLQLNENQISQLDQSFLEHKMKLIDYGAEMEKQDLKLQSLLDADVPNEGQIETQVDQVLAARGKLEREFTMMNLDLRKVLSLEQWRQLKAVRGERGGFGDRIFFRKALPPGGAGGEMRVAPLPPGAPPLPPLPPGGAEDEMF